MQPRKALRFKTEEPVSAKWTNGGVHEVSGQTRDVSSAGLFFYSEFAPENGSQIEIMLHLPAEVTGSQEKAVICKGRVVRVEAEPQEQGATQRYGVAVEMTSYEVLGES